MGSIKVQYLRIKHGKAYWEPREAYITAGKLTPIPKGLEPRALGAANAEAIAIAQKMYEELKAWRRGQENVVVSRGSVRWLAAEFYKDEMFTELSPKSQKEYRRVIEKEILPYLKNAPCDDVNRQDARAFYYHLRGSKRNRLTEYTMMVVRRLFKFGTNIGAVVENPFTEMEIKRNVPRDHVWKDKQIEDFKAKALERGRRSMWLGMVIASTIGTDSQTTRLLPITAKVDSRLSFTRGKNKVKIKVPLLDLPELQAALDDTPKKSTQFVTSEQTGKAYTDTNFSHVFREIADAAGIPKELQFKDLRRTAVGRLHKAGCEILEIAAIVGWAPKYCTDIIRHYFTDTEETAGNGIAKLVRRNDAIGGKKLEI